jgi:hypothetical protein
MDGGFWAAIITWGLLGVAAITTGIVLQLREDRRNK